MLQDCLRGVRVLDLSQYIPGPYATRVLADFGAEVIRIEPPAGDPMRSFGPPGDDGLSVLYQHLNGGKVILNLDLKDSGDKAAFSTLLAGADVVVESFRPGVMERLGFAPARLVEQYPSLVVCSLSGFGQSGPDRLRASHDLTCVALSGAVDCSGLASEPVQSFPPLADHAGGLHAVSAILAALLGRSRTGGMWLDLSLFEGALALNGLGLAWQAAAGEASVRRGEGLLTGGAAFYRLYRCADDRFLAFAPLERKFWDIFCQAIGRPDWQPRQAEPLPQRALMTDLETLFAGKPRQYWLDLFLPLDCCVEAVVTPSEVLSLPQVQARGLVSSGGEVLFPCHVNGNPPPPRAPARPSTVQDVLAVWRDSTS